MVESPVKALDKIPPEQSPPDTGSEPEVDIANLSEYKKRGLNMIVLRLESTIRDRDNAERCGASLRNKIMAAQNWKPPRYT